MNPILAEINRKANRRHELYLELGQLISEGSPSFFEIQVEEIKKLTRELSQLWFSRRAEGKFWMPRLREGKSGQGVYQRRLGGGIHGYRR